MAERALEDSWIDNVPAPVALLDPAGVVTAVNAPFRACFLLGQPRDAAGTCIPLSELLQTGDQATLAAGVRAVLARRAARYTLDFREPHGRGRQHFHLEIVPVPQEGAAAFLWELDARPTASPTSSQSEAGGTQSAGKSVHDLKNMLGVIMGSAEEMLAQLDADSPMRLDAEAVKQAAARAVDLVADILLQTRQRQATPSDASGRSARTGRGSEQVLLVEDDYRVRLSSARALTNLGYRVLAAESAKEALELVSAQGSAVDLLLTDVLLAGMSGAELGAQLRAQYPNLRMLFMSGYSVESVRKQLPDGFHGFLEKPFSPQQLGFAVRRALDLVHP